MRAFPSRFVLQLSRKAGAVLAVVALVVGAAGLLLGMGAAPDQSDAEAESSASYRTAFESAIVRSRRVALARGFRSGIRQGLREGKGAGRTSGAEAGEAAAQTELVAIAEAEAAAAAAEAEAAATNDYVWCDTDGYCLQQSPGSGGPACPPGTVENAGGLVCVPQP